MDIETYTNPIDQSIAHLLFHRPSDLSLSPDEDVLTNKSHLLVTLQKNFFFLRTAIQTYKVCRIVPHLAIIISTDSSAQQ